MGKEEKGIYTGSTPQFFLPAKSDTFLVFAVQPKTFDLCMQSWENDWSETFHPALTLPISN